MSAWTSRITCLLAAVVLLVTGIGVPSASAETGWSQNPVASSKADSLSCADLLFVGVRGSGEQAPYGTTIGALEQELATHTQKSHDGLRVNQIYLDYPAVSLDQLSLDTIENMVLPTSSESASPYFSSVDAGVSELERFATDEAKRCPSQKLLVAGFSQGAEVATRALASGKLDSSALGVLLLGNPLHYDGQNVNELEGSASNRAYGLSAALYFLRSQASSVSGASREQQVQSLLTSLFSMYNGTVDTPVLNAAMSAVGADIPGTDAPLSWSVCMSGDSVCDSAGALSRLLTSTATVQEERDRARSPHESYTPANVPKTLAALEAKIDAMPATQGRGAASSLAKHSVLPVVGIAAAAVVVISASAVFWLRRNRSSRGSHE
ncbi:MAG: cutinase family protein [Propionibacterium sp.]